MLSAGEGGGGLNLFYLHPFLKKVMFILLLLLFILLLCIFIF